MCWGGHSTTGSICFIREFSFCFFLRKKKQTRRLSPKGANENKTVERHKPDWLLFTPLHNGEGGQEWGAVAHRILSSSYQMWWNGREITTEKVAVGNLRHAHDAVCCFCFLPFPLLLSLHCPLCLFRWSVSWKWKSRKKKINKMFSRKLSLSIVGTSRLSRNQVPILR